MLEVLVLVLLMLVLFAAFPSRSSSAGGAHVDRRDLEDPPVRDYDLDDDGDAG